jgi:hypothetical protein
MQLVTQPDLNICQSTPPSKAFIPLKHNLCLRQPSRLNSRDANLTQKPPQQLGTAPKRPRQRRGQRVLVRANQTKRRSDGALSDGNGGHEEETCVCEALSGDF